MSQQGVGLCVEPVWHAVYMPNTEWSDKVLRVIDAEVQRIAALESPVGREQEVRDLMQLLSPLFAQLGQVRSDAVAEVLEDMTMDEAALVFGLSRQRVGQLAHRSELFS